jgi:hypothetical protein
MADGLTARGGDMREAIYLLTLKIAARFPRPQGQIAGSPRPEVQLLPAKGHLKRLG